MIALGTSIHTIITHEKPHLDEIAAIWLLRKFGGDSFPGIADAKIVYWGTGGKIPDGHSPEAYELQGFLLTGVGGGRFDEHPTTNGDRKRGDCAATLVAKALEINEDPALQKILKYTLVNDTLAAGTPPFELAALVKLLHKQFPENPEVALEWCIAGLEAKYHEAAEFFSSTKQEYEAKARFETVTGRKGRPLTVASIESDDTQVARFARSTLGGQVAVVIQKRSSGNVQIFTNKRYTGTDGLNLDDVAQILRIEEQRAKGNMVTWEWTVLRTEGSVEGAEEWYYHTAGQMLLNGSLTATDVPPTSLSLEQIQSAVRIGLNPYLFEATRFAECRGNICTSTRRNECPWYDWGLQRCRGVRAAMKRQQVVVSK